MALPLQSLLKLPACVRLQVFQLQKAPSTLSRSTTYGSGHRTFTNASRQYAKKPTRIAPSIPVKHNAKVDARKRPALSANQPPQPASSPPSAYSPAQAPPRAASYASQLLSASKDGNVLLYHAPSHTSFTISSFILGSLILFGAYNWADFVYREKPYTETAESGRSQAPTPWYLKAFSGSVCIFMAVIATSITLAPSKMIKSVSLRTAVTGTELRFEIKRPLPLPFLKARVIKQRPSEVFMDRSVESTSDAGIRFNTVYLSHADEFTNAALARRPRQSMIQRLGSFNKSLLNIWPTVRRDARRMLLRDGMAYLRITGEGNWKLDLQGSYLLDDGRPLERLTVADPNLRAAGGVMAMIKRNFLR